MSKDQISLPASRLPCTHKPLVSVGIAFWDNLNKHRPANGGLPAGDLDGRTIDVTVVHPPIGHHHGGWMDEWMGAGSTAVDYRQPLRGMDGAIQAYRLVREDMIDSRHPVSALPIRARAQSIHPFLPTDRPTLLGGQNQSSITARKSQMVDWFHLGRQPARAKNKIKEWA